MTVYFTARLYTLIHVPIIDASTILNSNLINFRFWLFTYRFLHIIKSYLFFIAIIWITLHTIERYLVVIWDMIFNMAFLQCILYNALWTRHFEYMNFRYDTPWEFIEERTTSELRISAAPKVPETNKQFQCVGEQSNLWVGNLSRTRLYRTIFLTAANIYRQIQCKLIQFWKRLIWGAIVFAVHKCLWHRRISQILFYLY